MLTVVISSRAISGAARATAATMVTIADPIMRSVLLRNADQVRLRRRDGRADAANTAGERVLGAVAGLVSAMSLVADARVDDRVEEIDDEVDEKEGDPGQQCRRLHDRIVAGADGVDREQAHARPREDRFHNDRA